MKCQAVDELRREAGSLFTRAETTACQDSCHKALDNAFALLDRAADVEQAWIEMVAGSEPAK